MDSVRVDKWVWSVRMVKTRTLAGELCRLGRVTVNDDPVKASRSVTEGDIVTVRNSGVTKKYRVLKIIEKRVSAKAAVECFEDLSPPVERDPYVRPPRREKGLGRPTKKERRQLDKYKD